MSTQSPHLTGPDFTKGVKLQLTALDSPHGTMTLGHAFGEAVLLVTQAERVFAVSATCSHYGGALVEGILTEGQVHCPLHHAIFNLVTGTPISGPALNGLTIWTLKKEGDLVFVTGRQQQASSVAHIGNDQCFVIVGGGAAGLVAAETLRQEKFEGRIVLITEDSSLPYDRPNLTKDFLAGTAPEEWIPLRTPEFYNDLAIETRVGILVRKLDTKSKKVLLSTGENISYDALLLTTGTRPLGLPLWGADSSHVHYLRTLADCKSLIRKVSKSKSAVVIGASFIGLEVAASLRTRGLIVDVVGRESIPFENSLGSELGKYIQKTHEKKGVTFHLGMTPERITPEGVELKDGSFISTDLVVVGVGVKPSTELCENTEIELNNGILVNEYLETSSPSVFAAGDVARYPEAVTGEKVRIEHWVLAQRQAKVAALNMLGRKIPFTDVPFFWSTHYDLTVSFIGYAPKGAQREILGSLEDRNCAVVYRSHNQVSAVATIGRDMQALRIEEALRRKDQNAVLALLAADE